MFLAPNKEKAEESSLVQRLRDVQGKPLARAREGVRQRERTGARKRPERSRSPEQPDRCRNSSFADSPRKKGIKFWWVRHHPIG
jgi:hypothetical protein